MVAIIFFAILWAVSSAMFKELAEHLGGAYDYRQYGQCLVFGFAMLLFGSMWIYSAVFILDAVVRVLGFSAIIKI